MASEKLFVLMGFVTLLSFFTLLARSEHSEAKASVEDIQVDADGEMEEIETGDEHLAEETEEESLPKDQKRIVREEILADASGHNVVRETKNRKRIVREQKKQQEDKKPKSSLAEQQHTGWLRVHEEDEPEEIETWEERWVREEEEPLHEHPEILAAEFAENQESEPERFLRQEPEEEEESILAEQIPKAPRKRVVREEKRRA